MERQTQVAGVRKWYGDAWIKLQNQLYAAIENGVLGDLPNVILSGCQLSPNGGNYDIGAGIVLINGIIHISDSAENVPMPAWLESNVTSVQKPYSDTLLKDTEVHYKTSIVGAAPANGIALTANNQPRVLKPYLSAAGNLNGLPKSDSLVLNNAHVLATSAAVFALNAAFNTLSATVAAVVARANKMGTAYYSFTSTSAGSHGSPTQVPWDLKSGNILPSPSGDVLFKNGGTYRIEILQSTIGGSNLFLNDGDSNQNPVYPGVFTHSNLSGSDKVGSFRFLSEADPIEIIVTLVGL